MLLSQKELDERLLAIAKRELRIETLETRNSDRLDFHEVSVASIKKALEAAYHEGLNHGWIEREVATI